MISVNRQFEYGKVFNDIRCLSTDEKPTDNIRNGSILTEIDTGKKYAFDAVARSWHELPDELASAVDDWLDRHPEATTTVQDGSITAEKLAVSIVTTVTNGNMTFSFE